MAGLIEEGEETSRGRAGSRDELADGFSALITAAQEGGTLRNSRATATGGTSISVEEREVGADLLAHTSG